jgi:hypothetical protein
MTTEASTAVIRQWARGQGMTVGDRGRLSPQLVDAYAASQGSVRQAPARAAADAPARPGSSLRLRVPVRPKPGATGNARTVAARTA